jgi:serine/threonine-protein kinase
MTQPATVGGYKIVRTLGVGLLGPVYLGTQQNQYWALRILNPDNVRATSHVNRLVGDVLHPSVVRYREMGADPQLGGYVSTDFVDSRPIHRDGLSGLRAPTRIGCLARLAEGVKAMHARGIIHGNIKRSNVLLRRKDAKVDGLFIDAGLIYAGGSAQMPRLVRNAFPTMAPELIESYLAGDRGRIEKAMTVRADVYALGMLIAEVLSGRDLHAHHRDGVALVAAKRSGPIRISGLSSPLEAVQLSVLDRAIAGATAGDPDKRPASVQDLIDALTAAVAKAA